MLNAEDTVLGAKHGESSTRCRKYCEDARMRGCEGGLTLTSTLTKRWLRSCWHRAIVTGLKRIVQAGHFGPGGGGTSTSLHMGVGWLINNAFFFSFVTHEQLLAQILRRFQNLPNTIVLHITLLRKIPPLLALSQKISIPVARPSSTHDSA